jgi:hypothetical protein
MPSPASDRKGNCPFADHALALRQRGIGPVSRMCSEHLLHTEGHNPDLPTLHADEGAKFAALAKRIAPPALVVEHLKQTAALFPVVAQLPLENVENAFVGILQLTDFTPAAPDPTRMPQFRYERSSAQQYFTLCARDPDTFLACFYLSLGLQAYVNEISTSTVDASLRTAIDGFGRQFNATNLVTALPAELSNSLARLRGNEASTQQIDAEVIGDALNSLHKGGRFSIHARGRAGTKSPGTVVSFHCPMEGYLFDLLVKQEALQPIIGAIQRANEALQLGALKPVQKATFAQGLATHRANQELVKKCARDGQRFFQIR